MKNLWRIVCVGWVMVGWAIVCPARPPKAHAPEQVYQGVPDLDQKLQRLWTRQDYWTAYEQSSIVADLETNLAKGQRRKSALGRGNFAYLAVLAYLHQEKPNPKYADLLRRCLLHEAGCPSADIQFALCRIAPCYEAVRKELKPEERQPIEAMLAAHADRCLKMESGTEMNRGIMNTLGLIYVSKLLPQHAHRAEWERTWRRNWQQGLLRVHDNNEDAINYNALWLYYMMLVAKEAEANLPAFFQQPWVKEIFERHVNSRTPLGMEPETIYGALTERGLGIAAMEWAGQIYRDGRFRWAAQRTLNLLRAQAGNERFVPEEPVFRHVDDTVVPAAPAPSSYYSHRRYDREFPNKLILRSGYGPQATFLALNLFHGGGHGLADGAAIYCLMDQYGLLLSGGHRFADTDECGNTLLVRRASDPFPYTPLPPSHVASQAAEDIEGRSRLQFGQPNEWQRMHVDLRSGNTAMGNLNVELSTVNHLGFRCDQKLAQGGTVKVKRVSVSGRQGTSVLLEREVSFPGKQQWLEFPLKYPLNLEPYDALEVTWQRSREVPLSAMMLTVASEKPEAASRWYPHLTHNWRTSRVRCRGDFAHAHVASVEVDYFDYTGDNHKQYRDLLMLPNQMIWVRDTVTLGGTNALQAGPLWHVHKLLSRGDAWFQTSTHTTANFSESEMTAGAPRDLLIVFAPRAGRTPAVMHDPETLGGRPHCVFEKWTGSAASQRRVAFDSFLLPNDGQVDPAKLAAQIKILLADDQAAAIQFGNRVLVDNPDGRSFRAGTWETDYCLAVIDLDAAGQPVQATGLKGTKLLHAGKPVKVGEK